MAINTCQIVTSWRGVFVRQSWVGLTITRLSGFLFLALASFHKAARRFFGCRFLWGKSRAK